MTAFRNAIVRAPSRNFSAGLTKSRLGTPIYERAIEQHEAYCQVLEECGLSLTRLEADERYPDSTFLEDTAVLVASLEPDRQSLAILTRPGAPSRLGEVESIRDAIVGFDFRVCSIEPPGTLDGGDVCQAGHHFFIGISERTNEVGAHQLAEQLAGFGYTSSHVDIRTLPGLLHLKSGVAYLDDQRLVISQVLENCAAFREYELIRVLPNEEYAVNCIFINDRVLIAKGHPEFKGSLEKHGYQTIELDMSEFQKMDGGLSCLSLRF